MDASTGKLISALSAVVTSVKGAAGQLSWLNVYNPSAAVAYVQLFDSATVGAVTIGTTPPLVSFAVAAGNTLNLALDRMGFFSGIMAAATTTANGLTAPASAMVANFGIR